jgi:GntR family transcriptional regulator, N-acetylglucosamine utilization regulator
MDTLPKYLAISNRLIDRIRSGELAPGVQAPSENEIIREDGVSNTTARKALANLEQLGYATRIKGRGTFVRQRDVVRSATKILSFSANMRQSGRVPSTKILKTAEFTEGSEAVREMVIAGRRYTMHAPMSRIQRLRFGDDEPILLEERFISSALCPGLLQHDLTGSLYGIYESVYGLQLTEVKQRIRSILLDAATKDHFGLTGETPGLLIESATFSGKEMLLEMEYSIYRGDTYQFTVTASGQSCES